MKIPLTKKITGKVRSIYRNQFGHPVVHDLYGKKSVFKKRALLVYLVAPFLQKDGNKAYWHSNWAQNHDIAEILSDLGYIVDVVNWSDMNYKLKHSYDLMLGMGIGVGRIAKMLPDATFKIYIATGCEKGFNNSAENARIAAVKDRRGCDLKPRRVVRFETENLKYFDEIVCLGSNVTADTYRPYHKIIHILNNYAFRKLPNPERNFTEARKHFMYLGSSGQAHKGLDLLLEVFAKNPDLHLHVCGHFHEEKDFVACYEKELFHTPNIHPVGWIDVYSEAFADLCRQCAFTILPSCAEGQAGSVVMCMYAGMIPVISENCGVAAKDFGMMLPDCEIPTIEQVVSEASVKPESWLQEKSELTRAVALKDFSPEAFRSRWQEILTGVLNKTEKEDLAV